MARIITFSTKFPAYHPKKGQPTYFVEKVNKSLGFEYGIPFGDQTEKHFADQGIEYSHKIFCEVDPKYHTIREGHHWKVGDKASPRVWGTNINPKTGRSGPYHSKQIIIAPVIEIKKVWDFVIKEDDADEPSIYLNGKHFAQIGAGDSIKLALNDGLSLEDMKGWFRYPKPFDGQIICWSDKIEY